MKASSRWHGPGGAAIQAGVRRPRSSRLSYGVTNFQPRAPGGRRGQLIVAGNLDVNIMMHAGHFPQNRSTAQPLAICHGRSNPSSSAASAATGAKPRAAAHQALARGSSCAKSRAPAAGGWPYSPGSRAR